MKLKDMRDKRGMTQHELSVKADVGLKSVQSYEQGLRDINKAQAIIVYRLAQALKCAMEDLIEKP